MFHHLRFSSDSPGVAFCTTLMDSPKIKLQVLKSLEIRPPSQLPPEIVPLGPSDERK